MSTGGTLEEGSEFDGYSPSELAATVKALWARQEERPIPEDIPWSEFDPEKVMLRFRDELNRLQPRIEALYADRGTRTADWPRLYKVEPRKPAVLTAGMIGAQIPFAQTRAKHASSKRTV